MEVSRKKRAKWMRKRQKVKKRRRRRRNLGYVICALPPLDHVRGPVFIHFECFNIPPAFFWANVESPPKKLNDDKRRKQKGKKQTSTTESWSSNSQLKSCANQLTLIVGPPKALMNRSKSEKKK